MTLQIIFGEKEAFNSIGKVIGNNLQPKRPQRSIKATDVPTLS